MRLLPRRRGERPVKASRKAVEVRISGAVAGRIDLDPLDPLVAEWVRECTLTTSEDAGVHHLLGDEWGRIDLFSGPHAACGSRVTEVVTRSFEECAQLPICARCTRSLHHVRVRSRGLDTPVFTLTHQLGVWRARPASPERLRELLERPAQPGAGKVRCCRAHQAAPWSERVRRLGVEHRYAARQLGETRRWIGECERVEDHAPGASALLSHARELEGVQQEWLQVLTEALRDPLSAACARAGLLTRVSGHDAFSAVLGDASWPEPQLEDELGLDTTPTLVLHHSRAKVAEELADLLATHLLTQSTPAQARERGGLLQLHRMPRWAADELLVSLERAHVETSPAVVDGVAVDDETALLALELWSPGRGFAGCVRDALAATCAAPPEQSASPEGRYRR